MAYKAVLKELGFAPSEIAVYAALLELDAASVTDIAKRSGIHRTSCYEVLEHLMKRGLVGKYKKKKKIFFTAGDPRRLLSYMDREAEEVHKAIQQKKQRIQDILPELISLIRPHSTKPKITFFEGEKGMREAYEDTLTSKGEILAYANVQAMHEGLPNFFPEYYKRRAGAGVAIKAILTDNPLSRERAKHDKQEMRQSVFMGADTSFTPEIDIYDNKILLTSWKEKLSIMIESKELADMQRVIYRLLWWQLMGAEKSKVTG